MYLNNNIGTGYIVEFFSQIKMLRSLTFDKGLSQRVIIYYRYYITYILIVRGKNTIGILTIYEKKTFQFILYI